MCLIVGLWRRRYLLQLVQALRYEATGRDGDSLLSFLVQRAVENLEIANYL